MAVILGGAVAVGFVVICLMFARNLLKKRDGNYIYYWTGFSIVQINDLNCSFFKDEKIFETKI